MLDGASVVNGFLEKILRKCSQELRGVNRSQVNIYDPRVPEEDKKPLRLATPLDGLGVKLEEALIVQVELNAPIFVNQIYLHGLSTDSPHLEREELMERVYTSLWADNNRFVLLSAPSASGKSSLLILYAHRYTHLNCIKDQQHVIMLNDAEEHFDDLEFWNILIPTELQSLVTFEIRDLLLNDEEAREFLDLPLMGLPYRFKKKQFIDLLGIGHDSREAASMPHLQWMTLLSLSSIATTKEKFHEAPKYSRYKRATAFFLDWLLRARGRGRHTGRRVQLETFSLVVEEIATNPSILTPKLMQELPKALAACQCAITFRQHVASFFADGDGGHQHFLELLRSWLINLQGVVTEQQQAAVQSESSKFENYYNVLEVDKDYFPDTETLLKDKGASKRTREERERVFNEAFATDLKFEVLDLFMKLEELVEEVFKVYEQVKSGERSMVEETIVAKLAMDMANSKAATLQLHYPAFKTAVVISLHNLALIFPENYSRDVNTSGVGKYGEKYREEHTPKYMLLDANKPVLFLVQQFPFLYNTIRVLDSRKVTIPVVFACLCWIKSVAALQGNAGLSRNVIMSFKHSRELVRIMETTVAKGALLASSKEVHDILKEFAAKMKSTSRDHCTARLNPLMAGFMMVDNIYYFQYLASTAVMATPILRAFGHLYNALVGQEYLDRIPFFEKILELYASMIFTPSRATAVHVEDSALLLVLDGLAAKPFYFDLATTGSQDTIALERAMAAIPRVVCYMYGIESSTVGPEKE
ncbi:hypothetical protein PHYSODRAFT_331104 [Phytophthora sojae]|uniref:DUF6604 domain-containing protein n=1 Tax=Phytophthora sojae (strain P6497) TaxID=1094619 RepID=G4ZG22_PHYSP|nr:hypothetical protein PHYSODRAFT_331104 [Phytophthora sojae]EGZ17089.1 hypothetical protein PHYSODRAFT_331104 [Phytophthora sojae]|eukprot:XP_009526147.1 hypothetical protein PHYSODRAFT_331104 [Phytophthora sojae]